jgi:hypothetical protein
MKILQNSAVVRTYKAAPLGKLKLALTMGENWVFRGVKAGEVYLQTCRSMTFAIASRNAAGNRERLILLD